MTIAHDMYTSLAIVAHYYATVARHVRTELRHWRLRAAVIPDPRLRRFALAKLGGEHLNAEAAAVFATLVPLRHRREATRLMVAFQVMYDYLDAVSEQRARDPVGSGLRLHEALTAAVAESSTTGTDFYAFAPQTHDGGYLEELIAACRHRLASLPSSDPVRAALLHAAARCGEGQTRTHAAAQVGVHQLSEWGASLAGESSYAWWELAAGAASSLSLHALFAAAGNANTAPEDAFAIEQAYFPSVCALSTLLDAFVDQASDRRDGSENYLDYYATSETATRRLSEIADDADRAARAVRHGTRHAAITAGISAFYLSAAVARRPANRDAMALIIRSLRPGTVRPLHAVVRVKRFLEGR